MSTFKTIYFIKTMHINGLRSAYLFESKAAFKKALTRINKSVWLSELQYGEL